MYANPPWATTLRRREVGIGHHEMAGSTAAHPLHPGVLIGIDRTISAPSQNLLELVVEAVCRCEDKDVAHIVEESGSGARIAGVTIANSTGEEVVPSVVMYHAGVEDRSISGHRPCRDQRAGIKTEGHRVSHDRAILLPHPIVSCI
jgi:hypothetical protein